MFKVSYFADGTEEPKSFAELYSRGLKKAADRSHPVVHVPDEREQGVYPSLQFRRKQMRDRAFVERSAERRVLAAARALEAITDAEELPDMVRENPDEHEDHKGIRIRYIHPCGATAGGGGGGGGEPGAWKGGAR